MISYVSFILTFLIIAHCSRNVGTQSTALVISLDKALTYVDRELYSDYIHINGSSTIEINFINVSNNVSFIIFQVHSYSYNITISNTSNIVGPKVTGTDLGLYSPVIPKIETFYIKNPNKVDLHVLVAVHGYYEQDPIPGGCNMEFPIPVSPFMKTTYQKDYIFVDAAPAKYYNDVECVDGSSVGVEFYMMYMPERDFKPDTYYKSIKTLMTIENIRKNADQIPKSAWRMRRMLSAYPGTGAVYVAVARNAKSPEHYAVYVPIHTYACSPSEEGNCEVLDDILSKFICASLLFAGLFMCLFGHRFFKTEMFLFGMLSGVVITYILISLMTSLDVSALVSASVLSGVFFGAIWMTFWWFYGIPVVAVYLPALNLGFLVSAIIYNKFPADLVLLQEDFNFWTLFILIMLLISMLLVSVAFVSNILCCAVLGAYAVIYPIDFYFGSNLKYIIINTVRRATVEKFSKAVLSLPFQWRDAVVVVIWVGLAIAGFIFQHYHNQGRPPFPPPPRCVRPEMPEHIRYYGAIPGTSRNEAPVIPAVVVTSDSAVEYDEKAPLLR